MKPRKQIQKDIADIGESILNLHNRIRTKDVHLRLQQLNVLLIKKHDILNKLDEQTKKQ